MCLLDKAALKLDEEFQITPNARDCYIAQPDFLDMHVQVLRIGIRPPENSLIRIGVQKIVTQHNTRDNILKCS